MQKISIVINFCTNEHYFLDACIQQCSIFSDDIVVSYGTRLYDGTPENFALINESKKKHKGVNFVEYEVDPHTDLNQQLGVDRRPHAYWHNLARWQGFRELRNKAWMLFIDVDEIPDGKNFLDWLNKTHLDQNTTYKIANYWYYKYVNFQSIFWEDSAILIDAANFTVDNFFGDRERDYTLASANSQKICRFTTDDKGLPLIHHYSWVRTKDQLSFKLKNWGHKDEFNISDELIEQIFLIPELNIIEHHKYIHVPNIFNIDSNLEIKSINMPSFHKYARNDLCPCRLGKKFKDCHGSLNGKKNISVPKSIYKWD